MVRLRSATRLLGRRSALLPTKAAGSMASAMTANAHRPARQPSLLRKCAAIGAVIMVPIEPAAETSPKARVRRWGATTRAAILAVMPELVQASATPIITPAPITIGSWLGAGAGRVPAGEEIRG